MHEEEQNMKIYYITETKLVLNNQILQEINSTPVKVKPKFLQLMKNKAEKEDKFLLYLAIGPQVLVFPKYYFEVIPSF